MFRTKVAYDRTRILDAAAKARTGGRKRAAVELYRRVLTVEPGDPDLHAKLAPLLAQTGQKFDAWNSFRTAASAYLRTRQVEHVVGVYKEATNLLPDQIEAWRNLAKIYRKVGRKRQAMETLTEARRHFRGRRRRPQAIYLLRRARDLDPWNADLVIDLANLLAKQRQTHEAAWLLEELAKRSEGRDLRRVRGAQCRLSPTLRHTWNWIRAATAAPRREDSPARLHLRA